MADLNLKANNFVGEGGFNVNLTEVSSRGLAEGIPQLEGLIDVGRRLTPEEDDSGLDLQVDDSEVQMCKCTPEQLSSLGMIFDFVILHDGEEDDGDMGNLSFDILDTAELPKEIKADVDNMLIDMEKWLSSVAMCPCKEETEDSTVQAQGKKEDKQKYFDLQEGWLKRRKGIDKAWDKKRAIWEKRRAAWEKKRIAWENKRSEWENKRSEWENKRSEWENKRSEWEKDHGVLDISDVSDVSDVDKDDESNLLDGEEREKPTPGDIDGVAPLLSADDGLYQYRKNVRPRPRSSSDDEDLLLLLLGDDGVLPPSKPGEDGGGVKPQSFRGRELSRKEEDWTEPERTERQVNTEATQRAFPEHRRARGDETTRSA